MAVNLHFHESDFTRETRAAYIGQRGFTLWFTGISGSGKSTIAVAVEKELIAKRKLTAFRLDGDNIRTGLNKGLGFTAADRTENIRRIGEVAKLFADCGIVTLTSFISPYAADRLAARKLHELSEEEKERGETPLPFIEVHVDIPFEVSLERDKKGFVTMGHQGLIKNFTGVGKSTGSSYEAPEKPEIYINNNREMTIDNAVKQIMDYLEEKGLLDSPPDVATAEAESAKRVKEGQDIKEKRLLQTLEKSEAAFKAAEASGNEEEISAAKAAAVKAAGALKSFFANKHRAVMEAAEAVQETAKAAQEAAAAKTAEAEEASKLAQATQDEAAKLAELVATYDAATRAHGATAN
ncbi:adenylyl-sulfate kinase [Nannizzia gypsea CBS 118893]|uniref:Adenylyl-sulfate kinase n=1 Tax=Arthroderma gypseum (strain ATCC MYA-4604 / CBS 118893) TaxID=535722 RepID=E4UTF5_ARTGP|nr:adenylyl-sulfate kinase [Nannizzia gypsea CBS 118893]EFR01500.1 adenylyl-sulfate kinase [Nannizzia gypsea CBS 118893]